MAGMRRLTYAQLHDTRISGTIPETFDDLGTWNHLERIRLTRLPLSGTLPHKFFKRMRDLEVFDVADTRLSGSLPRTLDDAVDLEVLDIRETRISGTLPHDLAETLDKLVKIDASDTHISGTIPSTLGLIDSLEVLDLGRARLSGTIPYTFSQLKALRSIRIHGNSLSGTLPMGFLQNLDKGDTVMRRHQNSKCKLVEPPHRSRTRDNAFDCLKQTTLPDACRQSDVCRPKPPPWLDELILLFVVLLVGGPICYLGHRARLRSVRRRDRLLRDVNTTSATVLSDLGGTKAGTPVVIVDGKSFSMSKKTKTMSSEDPRHLVSDAEAPRVDGTLE
jgi:hypothetical protein